MFVYVIFVLFASSSSSSSRIASSSSLSLLATARTNVIQYDNRIYSTLADVSRTSTGGICQNYYLTLPSDWIIAPDNQDSKSAIWNDNWSTHYVLTSSGTYYGTLQNGGSSYGSYCCYLSQSGSQYKTTLCYIQILIMT